MKLTRKLIPAMIMLLVSAVLMSTASFAWFAMNTEVAATGMTVSAKSNDTFLQIKPKDGSITAPGIEAAASKDNATLYPAKYNATAKKFQYSYSNDQGVAVTENGKYYDISADTLDQYVLTNEFTIFMKDSAADAKTVNLKVSGFTVTCANPEMLGAIRIVVTCGDKVQELSAKDATSGKSNSVDSAVTLAAEVDEKGVNVTIQVYIDGTHDTVFSNNIAVLNGAEVEVSFCTEQETENA